ncbi:MAG TPA: tetratricopeptide repeat protein [Pyrinomonadaceae bacterium]|jgi:tetratricopeptide (TPR) repeat protein
MSVKSGGFFGFIKRLFGFGSKDDEPKPSIALVSDEEIDAEMNEPFVFDEEKNRREAEEMIAQSFEDEKIDADDPEIYFRRATGHSLLEERETALGLLDKALSLDAGYIPAHRLKAAIYRELEDYAEAVKWLDRTIALHSADDEAFSEDIRDAATYSDRNAKADDYQDRAEAHVHLNNFEAAIDDFSKAIEIDPNNDFLYSSRGQIYLELNDYERALADLNKALEIDEGYYNYANRARIYKQSGDLDRALRDFDKAIALNETSDSDLARYFDGYFDRAEIYMEKGDYNSAVRDYTTQIEKDPEFIDPYERRAAAYRFLGMDSLAAADEQRAAELAAEYEESENSI